MKQITHAEYVAALEDTLTEVFESFFGQSTYVEILMGEEKLVMMVRNCPDFIYHNMSGYFDHDGTQYAFERDEAKLSTTYYEIDHLKEGLDHVMLMVHEACAYAAP